MIHAFLPVSRDACFFEWSLGRIFGGGLWLASNLKVLTSSGDFNRKWISGGWIVPLLSSFSQKELCYQLDLKDKLNSEISEAK
jgi:hypothetical protein